MLWDIDGTLVSSGGVAARAFLDAVAEVTGLRPPPERRDYGGRLDTEIADMLLGAVGATPALAGDVLAVLERLVAERLDDLRAQTSTHPGVDALVGYLAAAMAALRTATRAQRTGAMAVTGRFAVGKPSSRPRRSPCSTVPAISVHASRRPDPGSNQRVMVGHGLSRHVLTACSLRGQSDSSRAALRALAK